MLQRKAKNPRGAVPICPGGKFLPDPTAGDRLFPQHGSKTCFLLPQPAHASQHMPKPYSSSLASHLRQGLPRGATCPRPHPPWRQEAFPRLPGHHWGLQSAATPSHTSASHFLRLLPLPLQGMRTESSAALLRCSSRRHSLALATGLAGSSHPLRSWRLFPEGSSRIAIHQTGFQGGPASSCPCSAEPPAASSSLQSSSLQGIPPPPQGLPLRWLRAACRAGWPRHRGRCPLLSCPGAL